MNNYFDKSKCFIIAEAGVNHNGDINIAKKLIDVAFEAGADAIKFQTFKSENLVTKDAPKAPYQESLTWYGTQFEMLKKLELSYDDYKILKRYCDEKGIIFISTPFDFESVDLLEKLDVPLYKVSSGDLTNLPLLKYIARFNKPVIISTGMANLGEVEMAVNTIKKCGNGNIALLHCTSSYPTDYGDVNLTAMLTLKNAFKLPVGYSDHTTGIEVAIAAVAMGAVIIEKHFTLDKNLKGPDHRFSLTPDELKAFIKSIRNVEMALGDGIKRCLESEKENKFFSRKSIVAKRTIKKGERIEADMVDFKRPEKGLPPTMLEYILGKRAVCDIEKDTFIDFDKIG
ncbi:N-acetylneuraminate synthase [Caldicellulosiruptor acetigenus]|uniref:N-acetylneuraminate synthase n=1 Tax=Caldicellulosiruptor acetigenus TaxID=301953 RepID=UPI00041D2B94|nr:N-acetylneuraminate synthase [Caldicellulosiruptor acetigenus]WAM37241.1 N-acetylneuraminate synthase [Caldicellulosiruptor acetigenus]